jgi:ADP-ribose pyrophosphatase
MADRVLLETRYLRCVDRDGWFFVERPNIRGVVTIIAVTADDHIIFVEQHRAPVAQRTIELPAGLAGDQGNDEDLASAARRELEEETGYRAGRMQLVAESPTSPGMTSERVSFYLATDLARVGEGGGVDDEEIEVHRVPLATVRPWLRAREDEGLLVAAKVYAGLYLLAEARELPST